MSVAGSVVRTTARIVSWLTEKSAASDRRLFVPASVRMVVIWSGVSFVARARLCADIALSGLRRDRQRGMNVGKTGRRSGTITRRGVKSSSTRVRSPSLPPPRHFVGNLTAQGLEEGTHFRPWHNRHGRSILHDDLDKDLSRDLVALGRRRHLPGAGHVFEELDQPTTQ